MTDGSFLTPVVAIIVIRNENAMTRYSCLLVLAVIVLTPHRVVQSPQTAIQNGGFETPLSNSWETHVYGAQPEIALDSTVTKEGRQSLRVRSSELTDTAFGQEITLKPSCYYRLTGWVRTRGLDPHGSPVYGTFQIQKPGGKGIIASGANHSDNTDWAQIAIPFRSPADGRARVAVFFVGYGKGTGEAWFDDLRLEEVKVESAPLRITKEPLCPGKISPLQYGQFIEYLCNLVPSMWAEKLYDGSFEGLTPYKITYLKETDFKEHPWYPSGATNRVECSLDRETKISGEVSQRIRIDAGAPATAGISQDGIAVQRGTACKFSVYLKSSIPNMPVMVRLHRDGREVASCRFTSEADWRKFTAPMDPTETDANATLSIEFRGPGTVWVDNASLMPEDNVGGWRKDVVEALRALKPGVIRFGGSALDDFNLGDFRWRDTLGDPDRRNPFRAWGGLQTAGAGLEEIVQLCHAVNAEPLICVRFTHSTPEEAASQVEYFNGSVDTPMGKMRAVNGHAKPYRIKFWQVGNEVGSAEYATHLADFCKAMKRADPSIRILSSYPTENVLKNAGALLDFVCPHHYGCADLAGMENDFNRLRSRIKQYAPGRDIRVAVTEWNTTAGDFGPHRAMLWTLENALACSRYHNLMHRNADLVEIANRSNLTNSFCSGIIQTDNHRLYKTPTYYAQQLYATLAGDQPLRIDSKIAADVAPDVSATLSHDGKQVVIFAVNDTAEEITRAIDLSEFGAAGQKAEVWTLTDTKRAGEPDVTNSFEQPERVVPVRSSFSAGSARFEYRFPACTLTVIRWSLAEPKG